MLVWQGGSGNSHNNNTAVGYQSMYTINTGGNNVVWVLVTCMVV